MKKSRKIRLSLTFSLSLYILGVMTSSMFITTTIARILYAPFIQRRIEISDFNNFPNNPPIGIGGGPQFILLLYLILISIALGIVISIFLNKKALSPIHKIINAMNQVSNGNFDIDLELKGIHELKDLSTSFNKMTKELSSIETLRRDFINNFSHEFKTPIVSIRGFAKLLKEDELSPEEIKEYLEIIIVESERLANLSTNVLNVTKYENMQIVLEKKSFRLDEQIRRAILLLEPKWSKKKLCINIELDKIIFKGDENLTQQIWLNLIDNAIKFSKDCESIDINLIKQETNIIFSIQDNGIGMNEETMHRIFDKFYQGDKSHANIGNGLGLSLVKSITNLCGGEIGVSSKIGEGSTFKVFLNV